MALTFTKSKADPEMEQLSAAPAGKLRLVPATSSFDFLEGAFATAQKSRKIGLAIVMCALTILTVLALFGLDAMLQKRSSQDLLFQAQTDNAVASAKLSKLDSAEGVGISDIEAHVRERQNALKTAIGNEVDVVKLTNQLLTTAPAGVEITSITFTDPAKSTSSAPAAPTGAASGAELGSITIAATVKSFALISSWAGTLTQVTGLSNITPTWSGGGESVATTVTADLGVAAATARSTEVKGQ